MKQDETVYDVQIENTNIIPVPKESRIELNKKLIKEDPLTPYKKISNKNIIIEIILFMIIVVIITAVIYKMVIL